jgi:hypothetical protein
VEMMKRMTRRKKRMSSLKVKCIENQEKENLRVIGTNSITKIFIISRSKLMKNRKECML